MLKVMGANQRLFASEQQKATRLLKVLGKENILFRVFKAGRIEDWMNFLLWSRR